jgi:hypothetical protein
MNLLKTLVLAASMSAVSSSAVAQDFTWTEQDVWTAYDAFFNNFMDKSRRIYKADTKQPSADHRGNGYRDNDVSGCAAAIWCQAPYFDMAINAVKLSQKSEVLSSAKKKFYKNWMSYIYKGEKSHYTNFDFDDNNTNNGWFIYDDIMWWTCALARAYEFDPSVSDYLKYAEESFCRVWYGSKSVGDTGSYSDPTVSGQTGGMYWQWQPIENPNPNKNGDYKSACINFPAVCAMATLYQIVPEGRESPTDEYPTYQTKEFYKEKAIEIYTWAKNHLVPNSGRVADGMHGGQPEYSNHLYNQATYIGASCLLYKITGERQYLSNARLAVNYTKKMMSQKNDDGIYVLPYETGYEQGIYCAIFAQYMDMFINELGQGDWVDCKNWIRQNIQLAWNNKDARNLNNGKFNEKTTDTEVIESYGASAMPSLMLLFPAQDAQTDGISQVENSDVKADNVIYSVEGKALRTNASYEDLDTLGKGLYILNGEKYAVR